MAMTMNEPTHPDGNLQPTTSPWLDAEDVAPLLSTTAHTLRRLARQGRSPIVVRRIGGRWRFSRRDLARFLSDDLTGEAS